MNIYGFLANAVDVFHLASVVFVVAGFFFSKKRYPRLRYVHSLWGIALVPTQAVFGMRCPLLLLSGYLRELAHPGIPTSSYYQPFVATLLKKEFGFNTPDLVITVITVIVGWMAVITLLSLKRNGRSDWTE